MELRFRQIHLDFHTSEHIPDVAAQFNPDDFARTLQKARVNSVTAFARCHHGWLYYDSKHSPERIHPNLKRRHLLNEQIRACHKRDIRVPIYTTVNWDFYAASRHPEWRRLLPDGKLQGPGPLESGFHGTLCVNTGYFDWLKDHVSDIFNCIEEVDGFFFDIVMLGECLCSNCISDMVALKLDPTSKDDRLKFSKIVIDRFRHKMTAHARNFSKDAAIFYNAGHVGPLLRESHDAFTHYELESLPSGGWGYAHFPITVRYARTLGHDCLGMTGKFHTSWGDFHSFKNPRALEFECFQMIAHNAKCSVGDQLDPEGKLSPAVYDLIGGVYAQVEKKEPWCAGAKAITDIGVLTPEEAIRAQVPVPSAGVMRMLQEGGHQFDFIDRRSDFSPYKLLILPDVIPFDDAVAKKFEKYISSGGRIIASFESGMNPDKSSFLLKSLGVRARKNPGRKPDGSLKRAAESLGRNDFAEYIMPAGVIGEGLPQTEHVMYFKGVEIEAIKAKVLADAIASYFDRSWDRFCSHKQTPSSGRVDYPAITRNNNVIYFAHPIFSIYGYRAPQWCRTLFLNAVNMLLPQPILRHDGPSTLIATVNEQAAERRFVLHLLHYIPERRAQEIDVIEDVFPLRDIRLSLRLPAKISKARIVPGGEKIPFRAKAGRIELVIPEIVGHAMIELQAK